MKELAVVLTAVALLLAGSAGAQVTSCESERNQLRWLVQKYAADRAQLEFALATSEARRQAAEERLKVLEDALKTAPKGQQ